MNANTTYLDQVWFFWVALAPTVSDSRKSQESPTGCSEWYVSLGVNGGCEAMAFGVSHTQGYVLGVNVITIIS